MSQLRPNVELKVPTYHRQKLLLFLLEQAGGTLSKLDLQKLLFLYVTETEATHYAFVPYRFGCYSFLANDDLDGLRKQGWLTFTEKDIALTDGIAAEPWAVENAERKTVRRWLAGNPKRGRPLIAEVYRRYPYYATRREIKGDILSADELSRVQDANFDGAPSDAVMFTVGYEGIHFEEYANKLIQNGVQVLCDVRRNPLSRKFGFSQTFLASILPKLGIAYEHVPELGIESEKRAHLKTMDDYAELFTEYRRELPARTVGLARVEKLYRSSNRVALTCFESEPHRCHRHCVSDYLAEQHKIAVLHL